MSLRHWFALIGVITVVGMAKVAQQTALCLKGYALGRQARAFHELENTTQRLAANVTALASPSELAQVMTKRKLSFVAWSELPASGRATQLAQVNRRTNDTP